MSFPGEFGVRQIVEAFPYRIAATGALVLMEIVLMALIPLLIGYAIDGLLAGRFEELAVLLALLVCLTAVAVIRRLYDTRAYGSIRVLLGSALDRKFPRMPISAKNARLDMARELVDFLEVEMPGLLTAAVQIAITLIILAMFDYRLAISAAGVAAAMIAVYALFHGRFFRLNALLNEQMERQVRVLDRGNSLRVFRHLRKLRGHEVRLSDTEAIVYGLIFLLQIAFIACNLRLCADIPDITVGMIFAIITYSWEYIEATILLPAGLQTWSRLNEITARINRTHSARS